MMTDQIPAARWQNYILEHGDGLVDFWRDHLKTRDRKILFILAKGFDSRMCIGIETLLADDGVKNAEVLTITFDEGESSPSHEYSAKVAENWNRLENVIKDKATLSTREINIWSEDRRRRVGSRAATEIFTNTEELQKFTDIIIDVSAMPRSIYMPLIASILNRLEEIESSTPAINLHIWVAENPSLDINIKDEEIDADADFIHGFRGGFDLESTAEQPHVWLPLLGEEQKTQLERINELIKPNEICPVLPSPSLNPRRGDSLVLEYRDFLFDTLNVEPRNFIYAAERNPFEVYRQIRRTILHYREALNPLGGSKAVLSTLSSKLMSLGVLLVAYELKSLKVDVGIAHIEANGYKITEGFDEKAISSKSELFGLWIFGECYEY